jgi:hypothetical protein
MSDNESCQLCIIWNWDYHLILISEVEGRLGTSRSVSHSGSVRLKSVRRLRNNRMAGSQEDISVVLDVFRNLLFNNLKIKTFGQ